MEKIKSIKRRREGGREQETQQTYRKDRGRKIVTV
jgi:hypothetical protein